MSKKASKKRPAPKNITRVSPLVPIDLTSSDRTEDEKRPQPIGVNRLFLDPKNPRLAEVGHTGTQPSMLKVMEREFDLQPLKDSLYRNGFFWEEPLVAVRERLPENKGADSLVVIEGNRRLAAVKGILGDTVTYPDESARNRLKEIPVIVRDHRNETLAFVGFRHITGIKQWEAAAKAQYALSLVKGGHRIDEISQIIGDKTRDIGRWVRTQSLVETAGEQGLSRDDAAKSFFFSYLLTATDAPATKKWLGLELESEKGTVAHVDGDRLRVLWTWLYGSKERRENPVIAESRQIHTLNRVIANPVAVTELQASGNLDRAFAHTKSREAYIAEVFGDVRSRLQDLVAIVAAGGELVETVENREDVRAAREEFRKLVNVLETLKVRLNLV